MCLRVPDLQEEGRVHQKNAATTNRSHDDEDKTTTERVALMSWTAREIRLLHHELVTKNFVFLVDQKTAMDFET